MNKNTSVYLKWKPRRASHWSLLLLILTFVSYFGYYVTLRHLAFESFGYDLGNVSQAIWSTTQGQPLRMTTMADLSSRWALHFEPILLLFAPLYTLFPSPLTLVITQTVIVSFGAVPIYWLAKEWLSSEWAGVLYAALYLMFPALQAAVVFDFHGVTLAMTFLAFALWALYKERFVTFLIWSLLAMACKEDMPLLVMMMGGYMLLFQRRWKNGFITITVSLGWFVLANFFIIPANSPVQENIHIERYGELGDSMGEVITAFIIRPFDVIAIAFSPSRLPYWIRLTMPVAFTSLFNPVTLLFALPSLAINTLSNNPLVYRPDVFHYTAPIVPFIIVSSINGVAWLSRKLSNQSKPHYRRWKNRLLMIVLGASLSYHILAGYTPLSLSLQWPNFDRHDILAAQMIHRSISNEVSISAQNSLTAHLANRSEIYIFPKKSEDADYIALDLTGNFFPSLTPQEFCDHVDKVLLNPNYGLIYFEDDLLLFEKGTRDRIDTSLINCLQQTQ